MVKKLFVILAVAFSLSVITTGCHHRHGGPGGGPGGGPTAQGQYGGPGGGGPR